MLRRQVRGPHMLAVCDGPARRRRHDASAAAGGAHGMKWMRSSTYSLPPTTSTLGPHCAAGRESNGQCA